jgi:hypothetical protein
VIVSSYSRLMTQKGLRTRKYRHWRLIQLGEGRREVVLEHSSLTLDSVA